VPIGGWPVRSQWNWITSNGPQHGSRSSGLKNSSSASKKNFFRSNHYMLSQAQRTTILELHTQGVAKREIARVMGISRVAVRRVLRSKSTAVPELHRPEKAEPYRQQILGFHCELWAPPSLIRWIDANHPRQSIQGTSLLW